MRVVGKAERHDPSEAPPDPYVLLVAGDSGVLMSLSETFSASGHTVGSVQSVAAALAAVRLVEPAIVLFGLPLATVQSRRELRALRTATAAPVAYLDTAQDPEATVAEMERLLAMYRRPAEERVAA